MIKKKKLFVVALIMFALIGITVATSINTSAASAGIQEFDMESVKVTDSYYVNAFNKDVSYLQSLDADKLLAGFRETAKLSTKATKYGGWENSLIQGHTMGHYMSALAMAYKNSKSDSTLNSQLKTKIDYIVDELSACQSANGNGYLFATSSTQFDVVEGKVSGSSWVPWYTMHKILSGIIDIYKYEKNPKALTIATNLGNWIYGRTSSWNSSTVSKVLGTEYGGMNDCLYELYKLTKNNNHLSAAHVFDETSLFNTIANGSDVLANKHANTTIPKFMGALNRYRALGENEVSYLNATKSFWNMVVNAHSYVTGGNSENEFFRTANALDSTRDEVNNETCNSYNMLKITRELFKVTGDVKYADFYERAYINEILASQNPETGMATYFKAMGTGYFKVFSSPTSHFWCCTGTGMENFTKLNDSIYYYKDSDLYINMFTSSTLNWSDKNFNITQTSDIPVSDTVKYKINSASSSTVNLKIRIPAWIAANSSPIVKVNNSNYSYTSSNGYLNISRSWQSGDIIDVTFPLDVKVSRLQDNKNAVAFTYGPVVLSAGLGTASMTTTSHGVNVLKATKTVSINGSINISNYTIESWLSNINSNLVKTSGKLEFTLRNTDRNNELVFVPHYSRYKDRYGIYFTLTGSGTVVQTTPVKTSTPTPTVTISPSSTNLKIGDVNDDGKITSTDVAIIERHVLGSVNLTGDKFIWADANKDNKITTTDASLIERYLLGITNSL